MRNLISGENKRGVKLGGNSLGSLTGVKMGKLQAYYTKAVRTYNGSVEEMSRAVWATFLHCTSTDENHQHHNCPSGEDSWCFAKRAEARGDPTPLHKNRLTTYLNPKVAQYLRPVYERLTDISLLTRCLLGKTQNANESAHSVIWAKCPKHIFVGLQWVHIAVATAVGEFNQGSVASRKLLQTMGCPVGTSTLVKGVKRDKKRVSRAESAKEAVSKKRREIRRTAQQKEEEGRLQREGGPSYSSGAF